jgi:hypothetical protein
MADEDRDGDGFRSERAPAPGHPEETGTVGACLRVVTVEECEHAVARPRYPGVPGPVTRLTSHVVQSWASASTATVTERTSTVSASSRTSTP